jgi:hypothetical protein
MAINRRGLVLGIGGATALVAAGGLWRVTRMPESAVQPWALAPPPPADVRLDALRHAILAPNPHNRQPWLLRLDGGDGVTIFCDLAKRLPATDPYDRQTVIGFGTFIELARIAATGRGQAVEVTPFPDGAPEIPATLDARPVARLRFVSDASIARDPLLGAITRRRTTRLPYDNPPTAAQIAALTTPMPGVTRTATADPAQLVPLRKATVAAAMLEDTTPRTWQESVDLMRIGAREIDAQPDGLFLSGPLAEAGTALGFLTRPALADPHGYVFTSGLDQQRALYASVPGAHWIVTPGNSRIDQLAAGAAYMRTTLQAAASGLRMQPMSQALEEYPEMAPLFAEVRGVLGVTGDARLQMLARLGTGPDTPPSPRWPLAKFVIT